MTTKTPDMPETPEQSGRRQPPRHERDHAHGHCGSCEDVRKPGRPRSEAAEKAILDAAIDLLGEGVPYGVLSIEQIASRAGVGKATIYRRWANKQELVVGALKALQDECVTPDLADGRPTRDRLVLVLEAIRDNAVGERSGMVFSTVMAEAVRYPDFIKLYQEQAVEPRRDVIRAILRAGIASGELRTDLDVERALRMLVAPVVMLLKFERPGSDLPEGFISGLVDDLLRGLAG